jgi:hypothetical protein
VSDYKELYDRAMSLMLRGYPAASAQRIAQREDDARRTPSDEYKRGYEQALTDYGLHGLPVPSTDTEPDGNTTK